MTEIQSTAVRAFTNLIYNPGSFTRPGPEYLSTRAGALRARLGCSQTRSGL